MTSRKPKISVVLHAVKSGENVRRCINSILDQTIQRDSYEIIVIDDASTDDTAEVLRSFGSSLRIIRSETSWGVAKSLNVGVRCAQGELIVFTDVDCIADANLLEGHMQSHSTNDNCVLIGYIGWQEGGSSLFAKFIQQSDLFVSGRDSAILDSNDVSYRYLYGANMSMTRSVFMSVGMMNERLYPGYYSETELGYRIHRAGIKIIYNRGAIVYHSASLDFSGFSKRMFTVGRAAAVLDSINPRVIVRPESRILGRSSSSLRILVSASYLAVLLLQVLAKFDQTATFRKLLYCMYKIHFNNAFILGYKLEELVL